MATLTKNMTKEEALKKVNVLSGGEKVRCVLLF